MIFINPMWDSESERIGKQICTPGGYRLHVISDLIGLFGLLLLLITGAYLAYRGITGSFHVRLLWLMSVPFGLGFVGTALYRYSWLMALRKGFHYEPGTCEARWMEDGQPHTYKWKAEP
jgi:hypothetical protein